MILRLRLSGLISVPLLAVLVLFPVILQAYGTVAVAGLEGKGDGAAFYVSICENLLHEQLSGVHSAEYYDTRTALEQAHARSLSPEERLALIGRSGAELGVTGEIIVEAAELRFSFAAVELSGPRKGHIVARHHVRVAINPRGSLPETLICREQVLRFLEKLRGADLPGAIFSGACLNGANLTQAKLTGADLSGAQLDNATIGHGQRLGAHGFKRAADNPAARPWWMFWAS